MGWINYKITLLLTIGMMTLLLALPAMAKDKEIVLENDFTYDDAGKRDPLWPLLGSRGVVIHYDKDIAVSDMVLEGVVVEPTGESVAVINGNIVKLGDQVGMFVIKAIQKNSVLLEKGQEIFTLKIKKEE